MSEHKEKSWSEKIPPGGLIFVLCVGIGAGAWALLAGVAAGIESFGNVQRVYPHVIMGFVSIGLAIGAYLAFRSEKKDEHHPPADGHH